jgi:hypothetical protein
MGAGGGEHDTGGTHDAGKGNEDRVHPAILEAPPPNDKARREAGLCASDRVSDYLL